MVGYIEKAKIVKKTSRNNLKTSSSQNMFLSSNYANQQKLEIVTLMQVILRAQHINFFFFC